MAGAFLDGLGCQGGRLGTGGRRQPLPLGLGQTGSSVGPPGGLSVLPPSKDIPRSQLPRSWMKERS